jgi:hypothetical protein
MIISHRSKYVFCHIPKTGGTSIEAQFNIRDAIVVSNDVKHDLWSTQTITPKHFNMERIVKLWNVGADGTDYFRWSIVRHPCDWLISAYFMWRTWKESNSADVDLNAFIRDDKIGTFLDHHQHSWRKKCPTQADYLLVDDKIDCEWYKFEDGLDNIVQRVSERIQERDPEFPLMKRLNYHCFTKLRKDRRHYREVIAPELREKIETDFRKDFEYFGYEW